MSLKQGMCLVCENVFDYDTTQQDGKFCSCECSGKFLSSEKKRLWKKGKNVGTIDRKTIRKYLIEDVGNFCQVCKQSGEWNCLPLVLVVDHIDGNAGNNKPENVRLLCPNCNSQTPNFGGRNKGRGRKARGLPR